MQAAYAELQKGIDSLDMSGPKWSATKANVDAGATTYKVQAGNTLGQIVADYNKKNPGANLKWQDVAKWSGIADPSKMKVGHVINFADPTAAKVAAPAAPAPANSVATPPKAVVDSAGVVAPTDTLKGP